MAEQTDNTPLLQKKNETKEPKTSTLRVFLSFGIVIMAYIGSYEMAASCYKQYIYVWCREYLNVSDGVGVNVSDTKDTECGEDTNAQNEEDKAQAMAAQWSMYFEILSAVLVFISCSVLVTLSDYVGRKFICCLALFGVTLRCAIYSLVVYFDLHVAYFSVAFIVDGLCGSLNTFSACAYSSSADVTKNVRDRVLGVAVLEAMFGIGLSTTEIATGYFIDKYGYFYPMLTAACGLAMSLVLAIALLKETKPDFEPSQTKTDQILITSRMPSCRTLYNNYVGFYANKEQKGKNIFWLALGVFFLVELVIFGRSSVLTLYQLGRPFCWTSELIGWFGGAYIASTFVFGVIAIKPVLHVVSENTAACVGIISSIACNVITALSTSTLYLFVAVAAGAFSAWPKSIIRGMVSGRVSGQKQGAVFAGLQSSEMICKLIAGPIALSVYSRTLDSMRGSVFLMFAGICGVTILLQLLMSLMLKKETRKETTIVVETPVIQTE